MTSSERDNCDVEEVKNQSNMIVSPAAQHEKEHSSEPPQSAETPTTTVIAVPMGNISSDKTPVHISSDPIPTTSGKAIASLVCAIIGLFILGIVLGPVAICLAVQAKKEIDEQPKRVAGKCLATSGMVIGIIGTILSVLFLILIGTGLVKL